MRKFELIAPCHFGLEAVLKKEIIDLGYDVTCVEDGRVTFLGDAEAVCRANIGLRTAERILIKTGSFKAETFDELFENTKALSWEDYIPSDGRFFVAKAASVKSKLFSPSDIQSIMKKAIVERLKQIYNIEWFEESGDSFPIRVFLMKDTVTVGLDTTGDSLHKRGYRKLTAKAPIAENLAAALIMLTPWRKDRLLIDPFCGSGTIPIEAAMIAANIAPGVNRSFISSKWNHLIPDRLWKDCYEEAKELADYTVKVGISGYDIDPGMIDTAMANAKLAGVLNMIDFRTQGIDRLARPQKNKSERDSLAFDSYGGDYGFIITNPPYGERLEQKSDIPPLYRKIGERYAALGTWSMYLITSYENAEKDIGRKADKNRKIYNGMMKTYYYQFMGPKPPRRG